MPLEQRKTQEGMNAFAPVRSTADDSARRECQCAVLYGGICVRMCKRIRQMRICVLKIAHILYRDIPVRRRCLAHGFLLPRNANIRPTLGTMFQETSGPKIPGPKAAGTTKFLGCERGVPRYAGIPRLFRNATAPLRGEAEAILQEAFFWSLVLSPLEHDTWSFGSF